MVHSRPEFDRVIGRGYRQMNRFRILNDVFAETPRNLLHRTK